MYRILRASIAGSLLLLFTATILGCPGSQKKPDEEPKQPGIGEREIRYQLGREGDGLRIAVTFRGAESGETTFVLPDHRGSQTDLHEGVRDLQVQGEDVEIAKGAKPHLRELKHEPGAVVKVHYGVVQTFEQNYRQNRFRPIIRESGAFFIGQTVLGHPKRMHVGLERPVVFDWSQLGKGDRAVHSFGSATGESEPQELKTALGAVQDSLFLIGEIDVAEKSIRESKVRFAGLGTLPASADALSKSILEILRAQREFWDDFEMPPYLIGLYGIEDCCWSVGDAVYRGFASIAAQREPRGLRDHVVQLVAHEHLHYWIPDRLDSPRPFRAYMWFNEGFTEYYARRFKLETGLYDFETFVERINQTIEKYWNSPVRDADRTAVQEGFRKRPPLTRLPYQRGQLLALNWNAQIAEATSGAKSIDDVMLALKEKHASSDGFRVSDETLASTVKAIASGVEISKEIQRVIDRGEQIEISKNALGPCASYVAPEDDGPPRFEYAADEADSRDCLEWFR